MQPQKKKSKTICKRKKEILLQNKLPLSIYIHIPFCEKICPYCDFSKTSHLELRGTFFSQLEEELQTDLGLLPSPQIKSIFLGGGTPSLFTTELDPVFEILGKYRNDNTEITMEANPSHCSEHNLHYWKGLGINRLSVGVQSFDLPTRQHLGRSEVDPRLACERVSKIFENYSFDLIYGIPGQSLEQWQQDLDLALSFNPPHLSCYELTFEPQTILGLQKKRGLLKDLATETLTLEMYAHTVERLTAAGYLHDEISNFAQPSSSCRHNWTYWDLEPYLAFGPGAHGLLFDPNGLYYYQRPKNVEFSLKNQDLLVSEMDEDPVSVFTSFLIGGIRTRKGAPLANQYFDFQEAGRTLQQKHPEAFFVRDGRLRLHPTEWIRSSHWTEKVLDELS